jgi:methylated-DNA-[protein]-cysteine S-methyltransferase
MQVLYSGYFDSPIGPLTVSATDKGVCDISFCKSQKKIQSLKHPHLEKAYQQLNEYFAGKRKNFQLPLDIAGSPFQSKVWGVIANVPYGKSLTYSELASAIKKPKAFRAAANACGKNHIPIIIPCHRIFGKNNLGGFSGGLNIKKKLLALEGVNYPK